MGHRQEFCDRPSAVGVAATEESYAQIAEIEGVRIGTIKSRLWPARRRVANHDPGGRRDGARYTPLVLRQ